MKALFFLFGIIFISNQAVSQLRVFPDGSTSLGTIENYPGYRLGIKAQPKLSALVTFTDDPNGDLYLHAHTSYCTAKSTKNWVVDCWDHGRNNWTDNFFVYGSGIVNAAGYSILSDSSYKREITDLSFEQSKFMQLQPKSFKLKIDSEIAPVRYGFIAQDVKEVFPNMVSIDSVGKHTMDYDQIIPILTLAIQNQQFKIDSLLALVNAMTLNENNNEKAIVVSQNKGISISSNPMQGEGFFSYKVPVESTNLTYRIVSMNGNVLKSSVLYQNQGSVEINAMDYPAGQYLIVLMSGSMKLCTQKLIIE
jgi:hypothetical protein